MMKHSERSKNPVIHERWHLVSVIFITMPI